MICSVQKEEKEMKRQNLFLLMSIVVVASMLLAACGGAPATPAATEVPVATEAPTEAPTAAPAFVPMSVVAPDCNYGTADNPAKLKAIEAVDASTVKFTLCSPDPAFASKVAFSVFSIQSKAYLDANGGDSVKMSEKPNGTGPYMVKAWNRGDSIVFEANPNYWGPAPKAKTLILKWSDQSAQRMLELQSGTVDGIDNPAPEDFDKISADTTLALYPRAALNIFYIGFNNTIAPFDNDKVRQAISLGIDRQRIVDQYYPKGSAVATGFMPDPIVPGFSKDIAWPATDTAKAKQLLADAGYTAAKPLTITLSYRNVVRGYLPTPDKVAQEIQAQLKEIGVTVKLEQMESAAFIDATSAGQKGFYMLGWGADYPDATNFFDYHFANASNKQFGTLYPDIVAEINAAAKLSDPAARQTHYDKVNELLIQHIPMIPVAHGGSATAFKAAVKGAHASPLSNEVFGVMDNGTDQIVFMQSGEPAALWCSDETDGETLRACEQIYDALLSYKIGGTEVQAGLADKWESNSDLTVWTFHLRPDVKFSNGDVLSANDVVATYASQWDASSPNHKGRTGTFEYFTTYFGAFLNAPKK
jgi:peptide/nickel transport system substrate-binding protein